MVESQHSKTKPSTEKMVVNIVKQNISNKKIYFDADGTEIKIGYDDETGTGFIEIIDNL
jgi:hypothetical protein